MKGQKKADKQKSRGLSGGKKKNKGRTTCSETPYTDPIGWAGLSVTSVDLTEATRLNFRLDPDWTPRVTAISEVVNGQTPSKYDLAIEPGKDLFVIFYCIYIDILSCLDRLRFELQNYLSPGTRVRRASRIRDRERR